MDAIDDEDIMEKLREEKHPIPSLAAIFIAIVLALIGWTIVGTIIYFFI